MERDVGPRADRLPPRKSFGQNFLHGRNVSRKIVELARSFHPPYLEGGEEYGILSVYLSVLSETTREFPVRRSCFYPAPDVDSAVITIRFFGEFPPEVLRALQTEVRAGFAHRRKTLRNAPVPFLSGGTDQWCEMLEVEGIDPKGRAEEVPPASWLSLARLLLLPPIGGC